MGFTEPGEHPEIIGIGNKYAISSRLVSPQTGEELARSNLKEVTDIQYLAPNITFSSTNPVSNGGGYQIRGVGTQTYDSSVEQTVGLVVDGVVID